MKILALLSLSLTVVLGMPPFQLDVAQNPVLPRGDRSPVVGDWVPEQGHVVMEDILPRFRLRSTGQEKAPVVPEVDQSPLVDSNPKPEDGTAVVQQKAEVQEPSEVHMQPEVLVEPKVLVDPDVQMEPDVKVEPEVYMQPDVKVEPEVYMQPGVKVEPEVYMNPEVHMEPDVQVDPDVLVESDVEVDPEVYMESDVLVQVEPEVQMDPELDLQLTMSEQLEKQEEALVMEGEYMVVGKPIMELEPLAEDILNGEELNQEELSSVELAMRAEFQSELVEEPVMELEPLPEDEGLLDKREYVMAEEPVMELEPEMMSEERFFEDHPIMPDTAMMEAEPGNLELMGERNAVLEREYFLAEEPIMELEPEIQQVPYPPLAKWNTMIAEEPMMELEPLEGAKRLGEEEMVSMVGGPLYQQPMMGDGPVLDGGAHIGVEPEWGRRALMEEGVEMPVENELQPEQDHRDTAMMEAEPGIELMGERNAVLEGEYFLAEEPIMELEPEIQRVPYPPLAKWNTMIAEKPMMELEPLEGAKRLGEEEMVSMVGGPLYQQPMMGDGPVLDGGAHIGVEPEWGRRGLMEEGVEMSVENELQPEQDHRATRRSACTGVVLEGKCYEFFRGPKQAAEAEFFCQDRFPLGHLASVTSSFVHRQVMSMMLQQNGAYTRTWVGGLRYLETGRFIWLDGSHWSYADWLQGEPNNTADVENCVELLAVGNGKFNDMPCWDLRAFVCSYPYKNVW